MSASSTPNHESAARRFYRGFGAIPELEELPPAERRAFWFKHHGKAYRHWQTWAGLGVVGISAVAPQFVVDLLGVPIANESIAMPVLCSLGAGLGGLFFGQILTAMARPHLREALDLRREGASGE